MLSVRKATLKDYNIILQIYEIAREFMIRMGNPNQWKRTKPTAEQIRTDIDQGICHVIYDESGIHGVFALCLGDDPTYKIIEGGQWLNQNPYVTIHRIAGDQTVHGILRAAIDECNQYEDNIRIDTHKDNKVMQQALTKYGFKHCGVIYLLNGEPREAYQKVLKS
ncbi:MAG: N-acetyltransferase [Agathobacter sp.]|uniref:N-acetyltransferase n=1 Tax=Agathobacter sp. TaxID=2021311 RepID=UPI002590750C|nr:N-acetyltransferase [Agathobacter sp.]MCR5678049.1 N-acetyltransferase [Agathobacter sp.]